MQNPQKNIPDTEFLTERQTARWLNVARTTLLSWRHQGTGPPWHQLGKNIRRYRKGDVLMWLETTRQS